MLERIRLQKDSPIPLYYQLKEFLKGEIESGSLAHGMLIPSERELVEVCQISRPTVRQAISELVFEGLLTREKGRGTLVAHPKHDQWFLENMISFSKEMEMKGLTHFTKVISLQVVKAEAKLISIFGPNCEEVICLERLRFVENEPLVIVKTFIPKVLVPGFMEENLAEASLYDVIETKYGYQISHVIRVLEAINADDEDAELLEVEPMSAIQLIKSTGYLSGGEPFEYSIARYRGDSTSFTLNLKYKK
ncbi:GntR family transcriptional regulator [Paenibacillus sp. N3.4]|uniref:GntR family transcriptional regulator n=1 Tax=Paenibacillus sp. N3.4 TaxID=2603222 RepID=UPI0011CAE5CF|nr:GntR family transcriptional regulator [Paenibacillus sp. N3.4]TXK77184.1 GntR family transcriptional regulator [Paenibacillus sp. N3.4]